MVDLFEESDLRLKGVVAEISEEGPVLGQVWEMMGIMTIEDTNCTRVVRM